MAQKNRKTVEPTFEERLAASDATAAAALSVFDKLAADLTKAAVDKEILAQDITNKEAELLSQLDTLRETRALAEIRADKNYETAERIRAFVGN